MDMHLPGTEGKAVLARLVQGLREGGGRWNESGGWAEWARGDGEQAGMWVGWPGEGEWKQVPPFGLDPTLHPM